MIASARGLASPPSCSYHSSNSYWEQKIVEDIQKDLKPQGCSYDRVSGLWRVDSTGEVMMVGNYAQRPETKKCDVETGEDQKGE